MNEIGGKGTQDHSTVNQEARIICTKKWPIKLAKFTCVERNRRTC